MKLSTPARIGLRTVALLYLTVLLVVPIETILWRTFVGIAVYMVGYFAFLQVLALVFYGLMRSGLMAAPA